MCPECFEKSCFFDAEEAERIAHRPRLAPAQMNCFLVPSTVRILYTTPMSELGRLFIDKRFSALLVLGCGIQSCHRCHLTVFLEVHMCFNSVREFAT